MKKITSSKFVFQVFKQFNKFIVLLINFIIRLYIVIKLLICNNKTIQ